MNRDNNSETTLILVDDHEMVRLGLKTYIETKTNLAVIGTANSISTAKELLEKKLPQLIIIDIDLGEENGFELAAFVKSQYPGIKIIMYSIHEENGYIIQAKKLGVNGYISKASDSEEFLKCIFNVIEGTNYLENRLEKKQNTIDDILSVMTKKEIDVFQEMLKGKNNQEIAECLNMKKHSVEVYVTTIYEKSFCKNRNDFIKKYVD